MSAADIVPHQISSTERAQELGSKGGKVVSPNKKIAARLRELKKRGAVQGQGEINEIIQVMEDADMSSLDIYLTLRNLKAFAIAEGKINLLQNVNYSQMQWHKMHHGDASATKIQLNQLNVDARNVTYEVFNQIYEDSQPKRAVPDNSKDDKGKKRKRTS